jgi:hypothetical protein
MPPIQQHRAARLVDAADFAVGHLSGRRCGGGLGRAVARVLGQGRHGSQCEGGDDQQFLHFTISKGIEGKVG